ncbi:hypothetical protein B7494_g4726 [Chlorociboria aeruginascens]|nr:hypothetical protein B7494_g4726 [Chlorociboria aeruginascens]
MPYQLLLQHSCNHKGYEPRIAHLPLHLFSLPTGELFLMPNACLFCTYPLDPSSSQFATSYPPYNHTPVLVTYPIFPDYIRAWETGTNPYFDLSPIIPLLTSPLSKTKSKPKHLEEQPGYGIFTPGDVPSSIKRVKKQETVGEKLVETEFFEAGPERDNGFKGWSDVWGEDEGGLPPGWGPDQQKKNATDEGGSDDVDRNGVEDIASDRVTMGSVQRDHSSVAVEVMN